MSPPIKVEKFGAENVVHFETNQPTFKVDPKENNFLKDLPIQNQQPSFLQTPITPDIFHDVAKTIVNEHSRKLIESVVVGIQKELCSESATPISRAQEGKPLDETDQIFLSYWKDIRRSLLSNQTLAETISCLQKNKPTKVQNVAPPMSSDLISMINQRNELKLGAYNIINRILEKSISFVAKDERLETRVVGPLSIVQQNFVPSDKDRELRTVNDWVKSRCDEYSAIALRNSDIKERLSDLSGEMKMDVIIAREKVRLEVSEICPERDDLIKKRKNWINVIDKAMNILINTEREDKRSRWQEIKEFEESGENKSPEEWTDHLRSLDSFIRTLADSLISDGNDQMDVDDSLFVLNEVNQSVSPPMTDEQRVSLDILRISIKQNAGFVCLTSVVLDEKEREKVAEATHMQMTSLLLKWNAKISKFIKSIVPRILENRELMHNWVQTMTITYKNTINQIFEKSKNADSTLLKISKERMPIESWNGSVNIVRQSATMLPNLDKSITDHLYSTILSCIFSIRKDTKQL
jgi:hypothetical protein